VLKNLYAWAETINFWFWVVAVPVAAAVVYLLLPAQLVDQVWILFLLIGAMAFALRVTRPGKWIRDASYNIFFRLLGQAVMLFRDHRLRGFRAWVGAHEPPHPYEAPPLPDSGI
jgi:hypothetical protein